MPLRAWSPAVGWIVKDKEGKEYGRALVTDLGITPEQRDLFNILFQDAVKEVVALERQGIAVDDNTANFVLSIKVGTSDA